MNIYISQKIRLCVVDLEGQFQTTLQAKPINLFIWKFRSKNFTKPDFSWNVNVQIATVCAWPIFPSNWTTEYVLPRPQLKLPYASCCCFSVQLHGKQFALLFLPNLISQRGLLCVTTMYILCAAQWSQEMVFCYQNCSDLLREKIVEITRTNFFKQWKVTECFLTCSWRFLISDKLEQ